MLLVPFACNPSAAPWDARPLQDAVGASENRLREEEAPRDHEHQDAKADTGSVEGARTTSKLANAPKGQEAPAKACKQRYEMPAFLDVAHQMRG